MDADSFDRRTILFLLMCATLGFGEYHSSNPLMQFLLHLVSFTDLKSIGPNLHLFTQIVCTVSFRRFLFFPPNMEAIHSRFVFGVCWCYDIIQDKPVISVKFRLIFHDVVYPKSQSMEGIDRFQRVMWCFNRRIWDPGISFAWRINKLVQEKMWSIINNSSRLWSLIQEMIAKNDDLGLGLILERERNGLNPLASKASVSKASWKFTSPSFFLMFGYVIVDVDKSVFVIDVLWMYKLLYMV